MGKYDSFLDSPSPSSAGKYDSFLDDGLASSEPDGGFMPAAKQAIGAGIKGLGQAATDFIPGVEKGNALSSYGQSVIDANPTAIRSLGDIADRPWTAVKEATGNALSSMGSMAGTRAAGMAMTAAAPFTGPFAPAVAGAGQLVANVGPFVAAALPSYGGIRGEQIAADPLNEQDGRSKAIALLGAGTVGAIEGSFGPQAWALAAMKKGGIEAVAKNFATAKSLPGFIGKGALKGAAVEGAEELVQNPVEQISSYQDPTTGENIADTALSGAMGAIGGGVLGGGMAGISYGARDQQPTTPQQPAPQPVAPPSGPMGKAAVTAQQSGAADAAAMQQAMQDQAAFDEQQAKQKGATNEQKAAQGPISEAGQIISSAPTGLAGQGAGIGEGANSDTIHQGGGANSVSEPAIVAPSQPIGQPQADMQATNAIDDEFAQFAMDEAKSLDATRHEIAGRQAIARRAKLEAADARVEGQRQREAEANRIAVMDSLPLLDYQNPVAAFEAELSRKGFRQRKATPSERAMIQRRVSAMSGLNQDEAPIPSAPNELTMDERRKVAVQARQSRTETLIAKAKTPGARIKNGKLLDAHGKSLATLRTGEEVALQPYVNQSKGSNGTQAQEAEQATQGRPAQPATAAKSAGAGIAGDKLNREWTAFSEDSGTLGIPRSEMPQVKAEHRGALANFLTARGVTQQKEEVPADSLLPTQAEFSPAKVKKAASFIGGDRSILVSSDNHVLDGHHQWMAKRDSGEVIKIIRLNAPIKQLVDLAHAFPSSETAKGATPVLATPEQPTTNAGPLPQQAIAMTVPVIKQSLTTAAPGIADPAIDVSTRTDQQLAHLRTNGRNGYKEAAIVEIARRAGGNVSTTTPATAGDSVSSPSGQGKETPATLPKPTLAERKSAALERRKAKESATKTAEARAIAARAPEVASLADRLKSAAAAAVGSRKAAIEARIDRLEAAKAKEPSGKLSLHKDGIDGEEVAFASVPNGNDAFQYAKGRTEEGGAVAVYRRRADERGSYGGWRWEADTGKLIAQGAEADEARKPTAEGGNLAGIYGYSSQPESFGWAAKEVGGAVVYSRGDIALVEGFSLLGNAVYAGVKGDSRTRADISAYTGKMFSETEKAELEKAKADHVKEQGRLHEKAPDGPFSNGARFAKADGVSDELAGVAQKWLAMLGIKSRVFLATKADVSSVAAIDKYNLRGPFSAIRSSGTQNEADGGKRTLPNGDHYIILPKSARKSHALEALAHEIGHVLETDEWKGADRATKDAVMADYQKWLDTAGNTKAADWVKQLRAHTSGKLTHVATSETADRLPPYWRSFSEYFADQVSRWATTSDKPLTAVDTFFKRIALAMRRLYAMAAGKPYLPGPAMKAYLDARGGSSPLPISSEPAAEGGKQNGEGGKSAVEGGKPSGEGVGWLDELFGTPEQQAEDKKQYEAKEAGRKATIKANADTVRAAISEQIDRATKEREEWAAKVYKRNKTQVEFLGDGPARHESMSIGAINENRRRNAIEALTKELSELKKLDDEVSTDDGAVIVFANLNRTMDQARGAVASGNWPGRTNESMFEEILLSDMKFRGPGGRGSVTSNGLSRAMLAVVQAQQDADEAAPAKAKAPEAKGGEGAKDTFSVERVTDDKRGMETVSFSRGDYVKAYLADGKYDEGEITGVSHARGEFRVGDNGLWYSFGAAYKADRPVQPPARPTVPMSSVIAESNRKNGEGLTEADRVPESSSKPASPIVEHVTAKGKTLRGTIRKDLTLEQAEAIDRFTFKKDGGYFIREAPTPGAAAPTGEQAAVADEKPGRSIAQAAKLRAAGEKIIADADEVMGRDRLTNTAKRAREASYAESQAAQNKAIGETMLRIADAIEDGSAKALAGITARTQVEQLDSIMRAAIYASDSKEGGYEQTQRNQGRPFDDGDLPAIKMPGSASWISGAKSSLIEAIAGKRGAPALRAEILRADGYTQAIHDKVRKILSESDIKNAVGWHAPEMVARGARLARAGITNISQLRSAISEYAKIRAAKTETNRAKVLERALIGQKVGIDFFPTPKSVAQDMVRKADIRPGMKVLEPSAGNGNIAEAIEAAGVAPDVVEMSASLREILDAKGFNLVGQDFMQAGGKYDRIVMNPPFSNRLDAEHVQHAYTLLNPGGKIVAIMGEGVFFGSDTKAKQFREWLNSVGGTSEKLPEGTFTDRTLMATTGVNSRMVEIEKPSDIRYNQASQATITPSDSAIYDMAREGKSAQEILAFIGSSARRPFDRYLANALRNLGVSSKITLDAQGGWRFNSMKQSGKYAAAYNPGTDTVALFTPREATRHVLHEMVHAATLKAIAKGGRPAIEMRRLFEHLKADGSLDGMYGMSNIDEFVAEAFSNPKFQQALKNAPAPKGSKLKSAWEWFVGVVARMLGMRRPAQATALDRAMVLGAAVMNENAAIAGNATGGNRYAIAHHGTPHVFAPEPGFPHGRFRLDKMGTGEGAQAYGWGVYFAENKDVAGMYANQLRNPVELDGKKPDMMLMRFSESSIVNFFQNRIAAKIGEASARQQTSEWAKQQGQINSDMTDAAIDSFVSRLNEGNSHILKLDIPDDVMHKLLDWDKPANEQTEAVRKALEASGIINFTENIGLTPSGEVRNLGWTRNVGSLTGEQLYRRLIEKEFTGKPTTSSARKESEKAASEYLASIGVPGLRYLDGQSRNRPLKEIKREFLNELPEDAEFSEVEDLIGTGKFSPKNDALLKALQADDWLGFDYPAQAVSAALGAHLGNFDASKELLQAVESAKEGVTHNYVIWDQKTLDRIALLERNGEALDDIRFNQADDENVSGNVSGDISDTITIDGAERPRMNSNGKPIAQTDEALRKFYAWFGDSAVTDEQGRPLVVYHGSGTSISEFDVGKTTGGKASGGNTSAWGSYFTPSPKEASTYAQIAEGSQNVISAYLKIRRPLVMNRGEWTIRSLKIAQGKEAPRAASEEATNKGHDGIIVRSAGFNDEVIAFAPGQIKSATGNTGEFSPDNPDIRFNAAHDWISDNSPKSVRSVVANAMHSDKATSWITPFNTQYHKAEKWAAEGKPLFKKVFDLGQRFLSDVSRFAVMAQQQAPTLFHEIKSVADAKKSLSNIKSWGDITGKNHRADVDAIAAPLYEGTLYGGGSPTNGVIFSDDQLRQTYKLTDRQIKLYREALAASGTSMDEMAKSVIARHAKQNGIDFDNTLDIADMAEEVIQQLEEEKARVQKALIESQMSILKQMDGENGISGEEAEKQMRKLLSTIEKQSERIDKTIKDITGIVDKNRQLQDHGYFPLMRFGDHTVTAKDDDGNTQFFGMYEGIPLVPRSGQYQANKVAEAIRAEHPEWTVTTGIHNTEKYKLYEGMNLEAVQLFAEHMDKESLEPFQEFLRVATNDRSIMKRLIHRKGTPGFDRDIRRTLSQFIVSNARHTSSSYHMGDMRKAAEAAEQDGGDIGSEAIRLHEYVSKPREEAQAIRGYLFFNFLGGSIASAMVNLSQVPMMTFPYLTRYEGAGALGRRLAVAARMAIKDPAKITGNLGAALQRAEQDGVTAPQEIHQLTATAANNIFAGSRVANGFLRAWGAPFAMAESFNRRTTFIAAFQIAEKMTRQELMATGTKSAFEFAEKAVTDTQGIYNKGNRMNVGRGAPGAVIMTFRQFSIMYLELLKRMPPKQRAIMLGMLLLAAGGGGLPFEEDAEDIIDTIGQWLGFGTNASKTLSNAASSVFGERTADILLKGAASQMGIDLHSRFGMGNLIPGTGALKLSSIDKSRDAVEVFGPAASVVQGVAKALENIATGHEWRAAMAVSPNAIKNLDKGVTMAATGYGEDEKGRRTVPTNELESLSKAIGFNPKAVADYGQIKRDIAQDNRMVQVKREEFTSAISDAILSGDTDARKEAMAEVRQWNLDNPKMIVVINPASVSKRVRDARAEGADRFLKTVSRPMRADAREALKP